MIAGDENGMTRCNDGMKHMVTIDTSINHIAPNRKESSMWTSKISLTPDVRLTIESRASDSWCEHRRPYLKIRDIKGVVYRRTNNPGCFATLSG
jgi:hypothetical protein